MKQAGIRLEDALLKRIDKIAKDMSQPGFDVTRTDVIRLAITHGLKTLEKKR